MDGESVCDYKGCGMEMSVREGVGEREMSVCSCEGKEWVVGGESVGRGQKHWSGNVCEEGGW